MLVYKFGGASVKDADSVRNVAQIIKNSGQEGILVVLSAMGKSTNALEAMLRCKKHNAQDFEDKKTELLLFHQSIIKDLYLPEHTQHSLMHDLNEFLQHAFSDEHLNASEDERYSLAVSVGELISTKILHAYLMHSGLKCQWLDARKCIITSGRLVNANVNWVETEERLKSMVHSQAINILPGFIAADAFGKTATLGREGSDFTGAIAAYCLQASSLSIWKDVPGLLNADPKWFDDTTLIPSLSYKEATELAYYGASVIHPKTLKPLQNKGIPLYIRSFINPKQKGTLIQSTEDNDHLIPSFIFKMDQVLISLSPRDFSFVDEAHLAELFSLFHRRHIRINLMQNTALTFSFCIDNLGDWKDLIEDFKPNYKVLYNKGLELVTIRHYNQKTIERVLVNKRLLLEQRTRNTLQFVMEDLGN